MKLNRKTKVLIVTALAALLSEMWQNFPWLRSIKDGISEALADNPPVIEKTEE